jgi:cytochrome c551/c552
MAKKILMVVLVLFLVLQMVPVNKTNPDEPAPMSIEDMEVRVILDQSCMNCHSNNTTWPWYSSIAPISWKVAEHVKEGREELNFSEWGTYSAKKAKHKLEEVIEEIREGHMPEESYTLMHPEAKISDKELAILENWVIIEMNKLKPSGQN